MRMGPYIRVGKDGARESELDIRELPKPIKWPGYTPWFPLPLCSHHQSSPTSQTFGLVPPSSVPFTMFSKVIFASIVIGALSVSALTVPVARSPAPEPERESPRSAPTASCHELTFISFNSLVTIGQARSEADHEQPNADRYATSYQFCSSS